MDKVDDICKESKLICGKPAAGEKINSTNYKYSFWSNFFLCNL